MIAPRSPLRITLGGGGTDLLSYHLDHGAFLIAAGRCGCGDSSADRESCDGHTAQRGVSSRDLAPAGIAPNAKDAAHQEVAGSRPAVFLDRDGVLNEAIVRNGTPHSPLTMDELRITVNAAQDLARLRAAGFCLVMTTNQPNVARGVQSRQAVDAMNTFIARELDLDEVRACYHDDADRCACRKPLPGLLTAAPLYDLGGSFIIGDRWRDVEAGHRAGCRTVFIDYRYAERRPVADHTVRSLTEAVDWILEASERKRL